MSRQETITTLLIQNFNPVFLEVLNESHKHSGPKSETHYKVVVVSSAFEKESLINRHRLINGALKRVFDEGMHALSIIAYSPAEWKAKGGVVPASPPCMGGSKNEN
ncbi:BolA family transcriptional regulator [bacterium]|nr:BolA family transcriptional regulator [bacterium]